MFFMPNVTLVAMWVFILAALMMADSVTMRGTVMVFEAFAFGNFDFNFVLDVAQVKALDAVLLAHLRHACGFEGFVRVCHGCVGFYNVDFNGQFL